MDNKQMQKHLRGLGLKKTYRPTWENESRTILLKTRRPATIVDGRLKGSEIALTCDSIFQVWTPRVKKAKATAADHGLKVILWDGEAELQVPAHLADDILPEFGAKVKRALKPLTEAQRQVLKAHSFGAQRAKKGVPACEPPQNV